MKHSELRHQPRHVNPRIQAISVRKGVICCRNLKRFEKIFGYKKARTKHEFCASYWDSVFNCR